MKIARKLALVSTFAITAAAQAATLQTFSFTNITPPVGATATPLSFTSTYTGATGTLGQINLSGTSTEINGTTADFLSDNDFTVSYPGGPTVALSPTVGAYTGTASFTNSAFVGGTTGLTLATGTVITFTARNSFDDQPTGGLADNILNTLNFEFTDSTAPAPASTPATIGTSTTATLAANQVRFYSYTITQTGFYNFNTTGSTLTTNDTELGLYNASGVLVGDNDDIVVGVNELSSLGIALTPGTYYLAAGAFNVTYGANFAATSASTITGNLVVNSSLVAVPEPTSLALLSLGAVAGLRRRRA